jgi:hypothetical protein
MIPNWKDYLKNEETKYKKLGNIKCPAFNNEEIHFNYYGLRHIVYKGEKVRTKEEIIKRFGLMPYISNILKKAKSIDSEEKRVKKESVAYYCAHPSIRTLS